MKIRATRLGKWGVMGFIAMALLLLLPGRAMGDGMIAVYMHGEIIPMYREAYLVGVVAAEMPASYEIEALKAQAVAARTRTMGPCTSHPGADICTDSTCCQGYLDEAAQYERWGSDRDLYRGKIQQAVADTRDIIMTYAGEPIEVLYHAVSGGYTEDVEQVFKNALPYLRSVPSPGEEEASRYETDTFFSFDALRTAFDCGDEIPVIEILSRSETGRVKEVSVQGHPMSGRVFRTALGLTSTHFTLDLVEDGIIIHQKGYGHGVGMSQAGANAMAALGRSFWEILTHYYTGVDMSILAE